jgi:hypothetical protein
VINSREMKLSVHAGREKCMLRKSWFETLKERDNQEDTGVDGIVILKRIWIEFICVTLKLRG